MKRSEEEPKSPPIRERDIDLCRGRDRWDSDIGRWDSDIGRWDSDIDLCRDREIDRGVCLRERCLSHGRET